MITEGRPYDNRSATNFSSQKAQMETGKNRSLLDAGDGLAAIGQAPIQRKQASPKGR